MAAALSFLKGPLGNGYAEPSGPFLFARKEKAT